VDRITIVGSGLIGGSLAKALRARAPRTKVRGIDREPVLAAAGPLLDEVAAPGSEKARDLIASSELVVLAMPVAAIAEALEPVLDAISEGAVVTDTGSVKGPMLARAGAHPRAARFVGGHPMAGREIGGFESSSAELFEGSRWLIVDRPGGYAPAPSPDALQRVVELVRTVGAEPVFIDPKSHDRAMAYVSHAPQLVASTLVAVAARAGALAESGPGFRDMTRIAGGPEHVWRDILAANRTEVAAALAAILEPLERARTLLAQGDDAGLSYVMGLLDEARKSRTGRGGAPII
jgi:prephenate dehydrogenase